MSTKPISLFTTREPFESLFPIDQKIAIIATNQDKILEIIPSSHDGYWWVSVMQSGIIDFLSQPIYFKHLKQAINSFGFNIIGADYKISECLPIENCPWSLKKKSAKESLVDVYFIQSVIGGPIKIGISVSISSRIETIQMMCPFILKIIGTIKGVGVETERILHEKFFKSRLHGEWFEPTKELLDYVSSLE